MVYNEAATDVCCTGSSLNQDCELKIRCVLFRCFDVLFNFFLRPFHWGLNCERRYYELNFEVNFCQPLVDTKGWTDPEKQIHGPHIIRQQPELECQLKPDRSYAENAESRLKSAHFSEWGEQTSLVRKCEIQNKRDEGGEEKEEAVTFTADDYWA